MTETLKNYTIPLRKSYINASVRQKAPKALRAVIAYIRRHCKVENVKIGAHLNEFIWRRGIESPPARVKVNVKIKDAVAKVELEGFNYVDAVKVEKKTEETLKDKLTSKLTSGKKDEPKDDAEVKSDDSSKEDKESPKKAEAPVKEDSPKPKLGAVAKGVEEKPKQ